MDDGIVSGGGDPEDRTDLVGTADEGGPVEVAIPRLDQSGGRGRAIGRVVAVLAAGKGIEDGCITGRGDREHGADVACAATGGDPIEIPVAPLHQSDIRIGTTGTTAECMEDGFNARQG